MGFIWFPGDPGCAVFLLSNELKKLANTPSDVLAPPAGPRLSNCSEAFLGLLWTPGEPTDFLFGSFCILCGKFGDPANVAGDAPAVKISQKNHIQFFFHF